MKRRIRRNRKAVSPVIAALLLIAIAVAAAVVTYSWVMSMIKTQGGQAQTSVRIDEILFGQNIKGESTLVAGVTQGATSITVDDATDFVEGDYINITDGTDSEILQIESVVDNTINLESAIQLSTGFSTGDAIFEVLDADGTNMTGTKVDGIRIVIRNTGSVPATIQTIYVYEGDTLIIKWDGVAVAIEAKKLGYMGLTDEAADWASLNPSMGEEAPIYTGTPADTDPDFRDDRADLSVTKAYVIRVVTDNGFTVEGTYYTPSAFE